MDPRKVKRLEAAGWKVGTVEEFLGLTPEDMRYIDMKIALADSLKKGRKERGMTQSELAELMGSSQSRVARIEGGDPSVTIDLIVRGLLALGLTSRDLAAIIA